jgi:hypothetical protein
VDTASSLTSDSRRGSPQFSPRRRRERLVPVLRSQDSRRALSQCPSPRAHSRQGHARAKRLPRPAALLLLRPVRHGDGVLRLYDTLDEVMFRGTPPSASHRLLAHGGPCGDLHERQRLGCHRYDPGLTRSGRVGQHRRRDAEPRHPSNGHRSRSGATRAAGRRSVAPSHGARRLPHLRLGAARVMLIAFVATRPRGDGFAAIFSAGTLWARWAAGKRRPTKSSTPSRG